MIKQYVTVQLATAACLLGVAGTQAQISFEGEYQETFDLLGADGTAWLPGWTGVNTGVSPSVSLTLGVSSGSTTSGGLYNVGAGGEADRALGSLAAGTVVPRFGVQFQNTSGNTYSDIQVGGLMEQWRSGSSASANEVLTFEYSLDAVGIDDPNATWQLLPGLDLKERLTETTSGGAVDGNLPENQSALSAIISDANWIDEGLLTLRWSDFNDAGSDGMYALDNFQLSGITAVPEPSVWALLGLGLLAFLSRPLRR